MSLSTTARNAWNTIKNETIRRANTALRVGNAGNAILDYCDEIAFNTVGNLKYFGEWNSSIPTYETHYMYSYRGQLYLPIAQHSSSIDPYTDTTNWKPMTSVIGRTVTTQVQIDTFTSEPHVFLIDNRLYGIALPVDDEFLVCKNTYTRTVGAGGDTYIQEFTDSKGLKYQRVSVWGGSAYVWNTWSTCIVITTQNKLDSFRPDNGFANVANLPSMHTAFGADYISVIVRSYAVNATGTTAGDWAQEATNSLGVDYIRYFSTVGATWGSRAF